VNFYNQQHKHYCGIDLHAKSMYVCIIDQNGNMCLHKNMTANPIEFLAAISPWREDILVGVECVFTWYWLADLCHQENIKFVLGHALYMKAIHGAKAKNDRLDSKKLAIMLRSGAFPTAYTYPQKMRSTRDLLRRRTYLVRFRAELLAHIQNTKSQVNLPDFGFKIKAVSNAQSILTDFKDPMVRSSISINLEIIHYLSRLIEKLEKQLFDQARNHNPRHLDLLRTINGIGPILSMTILYEIHDINRFPRVQEFASYCRLVACAHESGGKRSGSGGRKIGNAHLKWAFSQAAVLFTRYNPDGLKYKNRLAKKHGKGKALSILSARLGRCVYYMLKRNMAFDKVKFLNGK